MATRFYLPSVDGAGGLAPAFTHQASWTETDSAVRRMMSPNKKGTAMASLALGFATGANTKQRFFQFISEPLEAQSISGASTFKGTVRCLESAINDNIDAVSCKVIVVNEACTSLTGTLVNLGNYGPVAELDTVLE